MMTPVISVIMPIHNAGQFLSPAISSVVHQSYPEWELIAMDDGSTDDSLSVARKFSDRDRRVRVESLGRNLGTATARNAAIEIARGKFLAFLDADDIALPTRLATQLRSVCNAAPNTLAASGAELIDEAGQTLSVSSFGGEAEEILSTLLFRNVITNSTVFAAREGFTGFRSGYEPAEDYDAWARYAPHARVIYSRRALIRYRTHAGGVSASSADRMISARRRIVGELLERVGVAADSDAITFHLSLADGVLPATAESLGAAERWLLGLAEANRGASFLPQKPFARVLGREWHSVCNGCWQGPREALDRLASSPLRGAASERFLLSLKLRARAARAKLRRMSP